MKQVVALGSGLSLLISLVACGGDVSTTSASGTTAGSGAGSTASSQSAGGGGASSGTGGAGGASTTTTTTGSGTGGASTTTTSTTTTGSGTGGGVVAVADPNLDGPYTFVEIDDSTLVAATNHKVPVHCAYPTAGPTAGPYPVVLVAHGFQLPPTQYLGYVKRLASFGYVAVSMDFPTPFFGLKHTDSAKDVVAGLDWAANKAELAGKADVNNAGATGHSLGGKVSLLLATMDPRIKASITLDPVDSSMNCSAVDCPDTSALMPTLQIPTGFVGETTDAQGGFQPCAPAADNFTTFYASANSPSLSVTVTGANHMSFLDNVATCGFTCSFCNMASAPNAQVNALAKAYVVAFYERYLRGNAGYDTYLTGAEAQARYVATNQATIVSK